MRLVCDTLTDRVTLFVIQPPHYAAKCDVHHQYMEFGRSFGELTFLPLKSLYVGIHRY